MSLKTINRKSIFLTVTDWSVGIIYHVRLEKQLLLTRDLHRTRQCMWRGKRNLTSLHKSGHWVLCGEGHWSGYTPVQSRCWYLRKGAREQWWRQDESDRQIWLFNSIHTSTDQILVTPWQPAVSWTTAAVSSYSSYYSFTFKQFACGQKSDLVQMKNLPKTVDSGWKLKNKLEKAHRNRERMKLP